MEGEYFTLERADPVTEMKKEKEAIEASGSKFHCGERLQRSRLPPACRNRLDFTRGDASREMVKNHELQQNKLAATGRKWWW